MFIIMSHTVVHIEAVSSWVVCAGRRYTLLTCDTVHRYALNIDLSLIVNRLGNVNNVSVNHGYFV